MVTSDVVLTYTLTIGFGMRLEALSNEDKLQESVGKNVHLQELYVCVGTTTSTISGVHSEKYVRVHEVHLF